MTLETFLTYALRLWWAGALYTGVFLVRIGPFVLATLGFVGWQWAQRGPTERCSRKKTTENTADGTKAAPDTPAFTVR